MSDAVDAADPVTDKGDTQIDAADATNGNAALPPATDDAANAGDNVTPEVTEAQEKDSATAPEEKRDATESKKHGGHSKHNKFENRDHRENIKSRFNEEESADHGAIRRQVEFYFSDANLPIDKYLLELTGGHANKPVEVKVIHSFKRMKHFQPYTTVVEAIKGSDFLVVNDKDEITRKAPLNAKFTDDVIENKKLLHSEDMPRSVYAKGFGDEAEDTHKAIESFFEAYGPFRSIRLRRDRDMNFKGSVFVEFDNEELQQKFLALDPKPQFNGQDLEVMSKQQYVDDKHQGIIDGLVIPRSPRTQYGKGGHHHHHKEGFRGRGGRGAHKHGRGRRDGRGRDGGHRDRRDDYKPRKRSSSRDRGNRGNRRGDRDASRSRSPSRDRARRGEGENDYDGDKDNWKERREHDIHASKRNGGKGRNDKKRSRDEDGEEREEIDDRATAEGKRAKTDQNDGKD